MCFILWAGLDCTLHLYNGNWLGGLYNCTGETGLVNLHNMCSGNAAMAVQKAGLDEYGKIKISLYRLELFDAIFQV